MLVYLVATFIACFFAFVSQRIRSTNTKIDICPADTVSNIVLLAATIPLFLVSALRVDVGVDYWSYSQIFNSVISGGFPNLEPGFEQLIKLISVYTTNYQWIFFASSMITYIFIYKSLKKSINPALSIYLFCNLSFFYFSLNATRQFIAISIVLFSLKYLYKRKPYRYILTIFLAGMFHMSALFTIPMYYLLNLKYKLYQYVLILFATSLSFILKNNIVNIILYFYPQYGIREIFSHTTSPSELFIFTGVFLLALIYYLSAKKLIDRNESEIRIGLNIIFFSFLMHTALSWIPLIDRAALYVNIGLIITIPLLISKVPTKSTRFKITLFLLVYTSVYTYISVFINDSHGVLPYSFILFEKSHL